MRSVNLAELLIRRFSKRWWTSPDGQQWRLPSIPSTWIKANSTVFSSSQIAYLINDIQCTLVEIIYQCPIIFWGFHTRLRVRNAAHKLISCDDDRWEQIICRLLVLQVAIDSRCHSLSKEVAADVIDWPFKVSFLCHSNWNKGLNLYTSPKISKKSGLNTLLGHKKL